MKFRRKSSESSFSIWMLLVFVTEYGLIHTVKDKDVCKFVKFKFYLICPLTICRAAILTLCKLKVMTSLKHMQDLLLRKLTFPSVQMFGQKLKWSPRGYILSVGLGFWWKTCLLHHRIKITVLRTNLMLKILYLLLFKGALSAVHYLIPLILGGRFESLWKFIIMMRSS